MTTRTTPRFPFTLVTEENADQLAAMYATPHAAPEAAAGDDWTIPHGPIAPDDDDLDELAASIARAKAAHPAGKQRTPAVEALHEAAHIVDQRGASYDADTGQARPERSLEVIAELWTTYLGAPITTADAATMMVLLKVGRLAHDPASRDTHLDIMGYAALGLEAIEEHA